MGQSRGPKSAHSALLCLLAKAAVLLFSERSGWIALRKCSISAAAAAKYSSATAYWMSERANAHRLMCDNVALCIVTYSALSSLIFIASDLSEI